MSQTQAGQLPPMLIGGREFRWGERTYVMGILNVSPESFSGDGIADVAAAVRHGERLSAEGADFVDVGGQSTRPPSTARREAALFGRDPSPAGTLPVEEEIARVVPVIEQLAGRVDVPISIDSFRGPVVRAALEAGATVVNDVWGLKRDVDVARAAAEAGAALILMHNQPTTVYIDLISDIVASLRESVARAVDVGVSEDRIIVDPGFGFGKTTAHNLEIIRSLDELGAMGRPVLLGTSRKGTIGYILNLPPVDRVEGTAATVVLGIAKGADIVRVHDVREMVRVARVTDAVVRRTPQHLLDS